MPTRLPNAVEAHVASLLGRWNTLGPVRKTALLETAVRASMDDQPCP